MKVAKKQTQIELNIGLPSSKSESNRILIIRALAKSNTIIGNLSEAEDTQVLEKALKEVYNSFPKINIGHAGTAMRFLTAYLAIQQGEEFLLEGSKRMEQRPIKILVSALKKIGADITYEKKEGYPPLRINGRKLKGGSVEVDSSISSQYISSLLMVAPLLEKGLIILLKGDIVSSPYLEMTIDLMRYFNVFVTVSKTKLRVEPQTYDFRSISVESDWSSASYWYEIAALSSSCDIQLNGLNSQSRQGDSILPELFERFGVETIWNKKGVRLKKKKSFYYPKDTVLDIDLSKTPDLAQTLVCTCVGIGGLFRFRGLSTLVIKETNRLEALQAELRKFNVFLSIRNNEVLELVEEYQISAPVAEIKTYQDHRMAMSFAPLCLKVGELKIENPSVVKKSYPNFWKDIASFVSLG